jgi:phenylpropionate dioxygenase-like ring-hydroxylating dioxygenase large terminal subunit
MSATFLETMAGGVNAMLKSAAEESGRPVPDEAKGSRYLLNCWYLAAWAHEFETTGMVARTICDTKIVLFKTGNEITALHDMCSHRFAPLSRGKLVDGGVQCLYHGLRFGPDGRCAHNPHGGISPAMQVRHYPTIRAFRGVWIWLGDPALADVALLPDLRCLDEELPARSDRGAYTHGGANYMLFIDNILDPTHVDYLHYSSTGGGSVEGAPQTVTDEGPAIKLTWVKPNQRLMPMELKLGNISLDGFSEDTPIDRHGESVWFPPCTLRTKVGFGKHGGPPGVAHVGVHIMTPETAETTHYFWVFTRGMVHPEDDAFHERFNAARADVFRDEDDSILEAIQRNMAGREFFSLHPTLFPTDQAAIRFRRKLAAMIKAEGPAG